jgi:putative transposase
LNLNRSSVYYRERKDEEKERQDRELAEKVRKTYLEIPFYGHRKIRKELRNQGVEIGKKKTISLMKQEGLHALRPKRWLSQPNPQHTKHAYLLKDMDVDHADQVWATDITYIPMKKGSMYLVAIMDWYSRYVISWSLSNTMDARFCRECLDQALRIGKPEVLNSDQGSQFTSELFTDILNESGVWISNDGKGRAIDNCRVERLWYSVKYEEVYLRAYDNGLDAMEKLKRYFEFYNGRRVHQSLGYRTPKEVYWESRRLNAPQEAI